MLHALAESACWEEINLLVFLGMYAIVSVISFVFSYAIVKKMDVGQFTLILAVSAAICGCIVTYRLGKGNLAKAKVENPKFCQEIEKKINPNKK